MDYKELQIEMERVKERRNSFWPQSIETSNAIMDFEKSLDENSIIWHWLSVARNTPQSIEESILDRLSVQPWESTDPDVKMVWSYIVRKENIPYLKQMVSVNGHNRTVTDMYKMALLIAEKSA